MRWAIRLIEWLALLSHRFNRQVVAALESVGRPGEIDLDDLDKRRDTAAERIQVGRGDLLVCSASSEQEVVRFAWPDMYVYRVPNAILDPLSGLTFVGGLVTVQSNLGFRDSRDSAFITGAYRRVLKSHLEETNRPVASLGRTDNFYHFMIESLPRVLAIHSIEESTQFFPIQEIGVFAHQVQAMFDLDFVHPDQAFDPVRSNDVFICSAPQLWQPSPAALSILRAAFEHWMVAHPRECVYVSRRTATRSLPFEAHLELVLEESGFRIVRLEEMELADQVRVMSGAKFVIAPHGAGLTHLAFMHEDTQVIELATASHWYPSFRNLACVLGIHFETIFIDDLKGHEVVDLIRVKVDGFINSSP